MAMRISLRSTMNKIKCSKIKDVKELKFLASLQKALPSARIFLVGGMVRDLLLGRQTKDYDFMIEGAEKNQLEEALKKLGWVEEVESRAFGVFKFVPKGVKGIEPIDVSLPRREHYFGPGYKDVEVQTGKVSVEDDLSRRDFTINAMALDLQTGEIIDPYGGQKDLEAKVIRAVGQPEDRFQEDPSRILRAIRLAVELGFTIAPETFKAGQKLASEIVAIFQDKQGRDVPRVAAEMVGREFWRAISARPSVAVELYDKIGLLKVLLPEVEAMKGVRQPEQFHTEGDVFQHTLLCLQSLENAPHTNVHQAIVAIALLLHDIGKPPTYQEAERIRFDGHDSLGAEMTREILQRFRFDHKTIDQVAWLVKHHLITLSGRIDQIKDTTLERYFFKNQNWGDNLRCLIWCDVSASKGPNAQSDFTNYNLLEERVKKLEVMAKKQKKLPPPLLNGHDIMKILAIKPCPEVGQAIEALREAQLQGKIKTPKEAEKFIKEI